MDMKKLVIFGLSVLALLAIALPAAAWFGGCGLGFGGCGLGFGGCGLPFWGGCGLGFGGCGLPFWGGLGCW